MALYEITLGTLFAQQQCVNRWNYETSSVPAAVSGSFALAYAFGGVAIEGDLIVDSVVDRIQKLVVSTCTITDILVRNVYDPLDFYQTPVLFSGAVAGDTMPPFNAYGFRTNRTRLDIRRGFKRIVGVAEGAQNGGVIAGTAVALADALATAMGQTLVYDDEGTDLSFAPVVVQKEKVNLADPGDPPRYTYRYYETLAAQSAHIMRSITWEKYASVRSQVSRQFNRGQ